MIKVHQFPPKDPSAVLDYKFDWASKTNNTGLTDWLSDGETILGYNVTVTSGITKVSDSLSDDGTSVVVWLSGGTDDSDYTVTCQIQTATRTDERSAIVPVRNR